MPALKARIEAIRLQGRPDDEPRRCGGGKSVPKMTLVSAADGGGAINTRSFIPHRVPRLGRRLCRRQRGDGLPAAGQPAAELAVIPADGRFAIEHPTGAAEVFLDIDAGRHRARRGHASAPRAS